MNVLSLFDGMSCGQIALERAGIKVDRYFACEIDKWAIKIAKDNYPLMHQLGDVSQVSFPDSFGPLARGRQMKIDLLIGGSPCQAFSNAGKGKGFDDPRGKLFWEYVRLLRETKPKYFLLENVVMKQEHQDIISEALGVQPLMINSADFSAQNRKRLYWTNIPIKPWDVQDISLADILETEPADPTFMSDKFVERNRERGCMIGADRPKARTLSALEYVKNGRQGNYLACDSNGKGLCKQVGMASDIRGLDCIRRVYSAEGKSPTLTTMNSGHREPKVAIDSERYRKLTPLECERLQTVPDGYTMGVSNTQRYKMLGNGWTVDVIAHIFGGIK